MNMNDATRFAFYALILFCAPLLTSCDGGGGGGDGDGDGDEPRAVALETFILNDRIFLPAPEELIEDPNRVAVFQGVAGSSTQVDAIGDDVDYIYRKSDVYEFQISTDQTDQKPPTTRIQDVQNVLLGGASGFSNPYRLLMIERESQEPLDEDETKELLDNIIGDYIGTAIINPANPLEILLFSDLRYVFEVNSTAADQRRGTMGGLYVKRGFAQTLTYRYATAADQANFSGLILGQSIMLTVNEADRPLGIIEQGPWNMKIENSDVGRF